MRDSEYVRGSIVRVVFRCEGADTGTMHRFAWRLQFHKGSTLFEYEPLGALEYDPGKPDSDTFPPCLLRD